MATTSYLEEAAGGMVTAAAFDDDDAAVSAVTLLSESGVREQDISVIARDRHRAERVGVPTKSACDCRHKTITVASKVGTLSA